MHSHFLYICLNSAGFSLVLWIGVFFACFILSSSLTILSFFSMSFLGFAGVVESLVNSGRRQIEGVNLAYAFELTDRFSPVPLLKAYLKEVRKVSQVKAGSMSPGAQVGYFCILVNILAYFPHASMFSHSCCKLRMMSPFQHLYRHNHD